MVKPSGAGTERRCPQGDWTTRRSAAILTACSTYPHDDRRQPRLDLLAGWLVLELRRQTACRAANGPRQPCHVAAAQHLLDTRFAEPLSMAAIAAELSSDTDYFSRLLRQRFGTTPTAHRARFTAPPRV